MDTKPASYFIIRLWLTLIILGGALQQSSRPAAAAASQFDISGPPGSVHFGKSVTVLPNGNFVVTDPDYNSPTVANVGAVYLYNGATGALISTLTGSTVNDHIGYGGVTVLSNGNFVVNSSLWNNAATQLVGAVTWGNAVTGVAGLVSSANSLVGSTAGDQVGYSGVKALSNGNYLVSSYLWDNGTAVDAGALTWGNGSSGTVGPVSSANSLVGSTTNDVVGFLGVTPLTNGNYVVTTYSWDNGSTLNAGAVTWGNGATGTVGPISPANSLVGSTTGDQIGNLGVKVLVNSNYVVSSPFWDNGAIVDAGAVTWGNGMGGTVGAVSTTNSLVGSTANDNVGLWGVTALSNGNYVVRNPFWDNVAVTNAGAATWGNGSSGVAGAITAANSLVGSTAGDEIGYTCVTALSNGNYVVCSELWDNAGIADIGAATWGNGTIGVAGPVSTANSLVGSQTGDSVSTGGATALANGNYVVSSFIWDNGGVLNTGAVTWGNGTSGLVGVVSTANSLVGSTTNDRIGSYMSTPGVSALTNGNFVVRSPEWDDGAVVDAGAATWGNGTSGLVGVISAANSLVGSTLGDQTGSGGVTALSNGNYLVISLLWDNPIYADAGAVTWENGAGGGVGAISSANSLVGFEPGDQVGSGGVTALSNGNYVVRSPLWGNNILTFTDVGAVTWGNGASGVFGPVSAANSLVGGAANDNVSSGGVTALSNGSYAVSSPIWDRSAIVDAGAITWSFGAGGVFGLITLENSVRGTAASGGSGLNFQFDATHKQLVVGRPADNLVTLFGLPRFFLPVVTK